MFDYKPEIGKDDDMFTITLVNVDVWLTKTSSQVYKTCHFHALATKWTNTTMWVLCPMNNAPAFEKYMKPFTHNLNRILFTIRLYRTPLFQI